MKQLKGIFFLIVAALASAGLMAGCSDDNYDDGREHDPQVIGNWETVDHSYYYLFHADGTYQCLTPSETRAGLRFDIGSHGVWWTIRGRLNVLPDGGNSTTFNFKSGPNYLLLWPLNGTQKDGFTLERLINYAP